MRYALFRGLQAAALVIIFSGLYLGLRDRNMTLELSALLAGAGIFYLAQVFLKGSK